MQKKVRWLLVAGIIIVIYFLSDIPNLHLVKDNQLPLWLKKLGNKYTFRFGTTGYFSYVISLNADFVLHKIGHIMAFGTLGVVAYWATSYSATWAVSLAAFIAFADEWHQSFVPGRSSRFGDVVLDTLAALVFILIVRMIRRKS